jgi:uncharacterized protein
MGLAVYGVSVVLMIQAELGLGPWDTFHVGLHRITGISIGTASITVGVLIVLGTLFIGIRPGPGTLANMVLIGVFIDLLLPLVPAAPGGAWAAGYFLSGLMLCGLATGMYISARLGKGPRDGLMIGVSQRTGWAVRRVRTVIEIGVLMCGWLMGGTVGAGTLLFAILIGPVMQWGLRLFGISATGQFLPLALRLAEDPVRSAKVRNAPKGAC